MIAKYIPMRSASKSNFSELVKYITDHQGKDLRLGEINVTNCQASTLTAVVSEVIATQQLNTRASGDKTFHLLVSFRAGETPEKKILEAIEAQMCEGLGYGEHQRVSTVHHDTDNLHIHIAINKIHPDKLTMHEPYQSYRMLGELCNLLEDKYDLQKDNHQSNKSQIENRVADIERHTGIQTLVSWIKEECLSDLQQASTWKEFHQILQSNGLQLRKQGNGIIFESTSGERVKASSVSRLLSKTKLENRLGTLIDTEQPTAQPKKEYQQRPVQFNADTSKLYALYKQTQQELLNSRKADFASAKKQKDELIAAAKRSNQLRRSAIQLTGRNVFKKHLYSQAASAYKKKLQKINQDYKQQCEKIYTRKKKTWADWLQQEAGQGNTEALQALRARTAKQPLAGNTFDGRRKKTIDTKSPIDHVTKKGTIVYRTGNMAIRDDGKNLQVSEQLNRETVAQALQMAVQRFGNKITINGSPTFKAQVIVTAAKFYPGVRFTNPDLEIRRQQLAKQEANFEQREKRNRIEQRSTTGRSDGDTRFQRGTSRRSTTDQRTTEAQPNIGRHRRQPPPQSQNRLRGLSELGVVRFTERSEVLLPGNVSRNMEQQRTKPDHQLRRVLFRPEQLAAATKYVEERNATGVRYNDIPKHELYLPGKSEKIPFAGIRSVDGQPMVLLKKDNNIKVLPINNSTAQRLRRVSLDTPVNVSATGSISLQRKRR